MQQWDTTLHIIQNIVLKLDQKTLSTLGSIVSFYLPIALLLDLRSTHPLRTLCSHIAMTDFDICACEELNKIKPKAHGSNSEFVCLNSKLDLGALGLPPTVFSYPNLYHMAKDIG